MRKVTTHFFYSLLFVYMTFQFDVCAQSLKNKNEIDKLLQQAVDQEDVPGIVALVATPYKILYHNAVGKMNTETGKDMEKEAMFAIASMVKPFKTVAAMMLYEQGLLDPDDPILKFLPHYEDLRVLNSFDPSDSSFTTVPVNGDITIRHLLTHTSGFGYTNFSEILAKIAAKTGLKSNKLPLLFQPGEKWNYGISLNILTEIIESITGMDFYSYLTENLFIPMRMNDTSHPISEEKSKRLVARHRRSKDGNFSAFAWKWPTNAAFSTAIDYSKFLLMLLNGGEYHGRRFLKKETVQQMTMNQVGSIPVERMISSSSGSNDFLFMDGVDKFGFGFLIETNPEHGMRSAGSYSWAGIGNTYFWVDPERMLVAVFLTQLRPFCDERIIELYENFERMVYSVF